MKTVNGKYASAIVFTDNVEDYALAQIQMICDNEAVAGSMVRIMPDVHPGKIGPIGLTMSVSDAVLPGLVGIDIGCGVSVVKLKAKRLEYQKLDTVIRERIPSGFRVRNKPHRFSEDFPFEELRCYKHINLEKTMRSMGSLGGGNHFIEVDQSEDKTFYVVIHSGSRSLGKSVAEYYMKKGQDILKEQGVTVPYELTYLTGQLLEDYLYDQQIVTRFAEQNRAAMLDELVKGMKLKAEEEYSCIHNYIETDNGCRMLRKGAISARAGEQVIIPINMRDGVILGTGKGNPEWNHSAPHGSGRLLKRTDVGSQYTVSNFKKEMKGIYSTCIGKDTLDEAPFAYRGMDEIAGLIEDTVEIQQILKSCRAYRASSSANFELADYMVFWLDEIYSVRVENASLMLASYVLYDLILPYVSRGVKLRYVSVEYLDALLKMVSKTCESAGNKSRELLNVAFKDAVAHGYISRNPVPDTKPYKRKKPTITVLNKEKMRFFLEKASKSNWYLEILLGLFIGLRKGEILGLKISDFDMEHGTVSIKRQVTTDPIVFKGQSVVSEYRVIEKEPKTQNSFRTLRVPKAVMEEVVKREKLIDLRKVALGEEYIDHDYLSCRENGLPHSPSSFNTALTKLCSRNGLPHITVHGLRHMYATILIEQGVPLVKVSALLGHASIHTTFEYYCEVMDENEHILDFMNGAFTPLG